MQEAGGHDDRHGGQRLCMRKTRRGGLTGGDINESSRFVAGCIAVWCVCVRLRVVACGCSRLLAPSVSDIMEKVRSRDSRNFNVFLRVSGNLGAHICLLFFSAAHLAQTLHVYTALLWRPYIYSDFSSNFIYEEISWPIIVLHFPVRAVCMTSVQQCSPNVFRARTA